ncbi:hypothetical protein AAG570_009150 [Ranatra chinensis]|uniref:Hflx-type G domain-containing protein n=1 Tax=Ranatra chinensis TaxID=642074 RepID=A0ABD0YSW8_9HEMI
MEQCVGFATKILNFIVYRSYCQNQLPENGSDINLLEGVEDGLQTRSLIRSGVPHRVFVVHPFIKWGPKKDRLSSPNLHLEEAQALINTLPEWKVVDKKVVSLMTFDKTTFFNKGQLEDLCSIISKNKLITAVFLNVNMLKLQQQIFLEGLFNVPVFDRYAVVVNIFKFHAVTKEAKLQVAMAEIPYLRSRLRGRDGESPLDKRLRLFMQQEQKIKKMISDLHKNRELLRNKRRHMEFPIIAVVGYTNAGKTSLIKSLTEEKSLHPEDKLFATLDVTLHEGLLPSRMKVLYVDTIGFISNIPTKLLEPFVATLEDALQADVIVHVRDISHPDTVAQNEHVMSTLKSLNLSEDIMQNIIVVGNKSDKVKNSSNFKNMVLTSCLNNYGIGELKAEIEKAVLKVTGISEIKIRIRNGGDEYRWLYKNSSVLEVDVDLKDCSFAYLTVLISKSKLGQFKHKFIYGK